MMSHLKVSDVMTTEVATVHPDTPYKEIALVLAERKISAVPVVDSENRVLGVVSEADLLHKVEFSGEKEGISLFKRHRTARHKASGDTAEELMSSPAIYTQPDVPIPRAARIMDSENVKRLPVVDYDQKLVGIVSRRDLLSAYTRPDAVLEKDIIEHVFRRALWLDPTAVRVKVTDGVATISGEVETKSLADIAVQLVRNMDGVVDVIDRLKYRSDDTEMIVQGRRAVGW